MSFSETKEYKQIYYQKNKDRWIKVYNHTENAKLNRRKYNNKNLERIKQMKIDYKESDLGILKRKEYEIKNKKILLEKSKRYYQNNKDKWIGQHKKRDKEKVRKQILDYHNRVLRNNKEWVLTQRLRRRVRGALEKYTKEGKITKAEEYGISYNAIIEHLKPIPENIRELHIHHIKPLYKFNLIKVDGTTDGEEVKKAFSPENHILIKKEEHWKINHKIL